MPTNAPPALPVGRIRRGAKVGGLLGIETARRYATKVANVARGEEDAKLASQHRRLEAAEHVVDVLGPNGSTAMTHPRRWAWPRRSSLGLPRRPSAGRLDRDPPGGLTAIRPAADARSAVAWLAASAGRLDRC